MFLRAAVTLNKVNLFRGLLEENSYRLIDRCYLSDLVREIAEKYVAVVFNGITRLGEALAIVVRYIGDDWTVEQHLVCMQLHAKSLTAEEIAREVIQTLSMHYSVGSTSLLAAVRDGASTNGVV